MNLKSRSGSVASFAVLLLLAACGGGGEGGGNAGGGGGGSGPQTPAPPAPPPPTATIVGIAAKGLLLNAPVAIHPVSSGIVGTTPLATTRTHASSGQFSATVTHAGPVVVRVTVDGSTTMLDELEGGPIAAPPGLTLNAALPAITGLQTIAVTPLTELAYELAGGAAGGLTAGNIDVANDIVGDTFLDGAPVLFTQPIALTNYAQATIAQQAQAKLLTALAVAADQGTAVGAAGQTCDTGNYGPRLVCLVDGIERLVSVNQAGNATLTAAASYVTDAYASIDQGALTVNGGQSPASLGLDAPTPAQTALNCAVLGNCGSGPPPPGGPPAPPVPPPAPGPGTLRVASFVYAALPSANQLAIYSADPVSGALTLAGTTSTGNGTQPSAVVADPARRHLYVANTGTDEIVRYSIDPATGALTLRGTSTVGDAPLRLAVDPLGRFLFIQHDRPAAALSSYRIEPADGSLAEVEYVSVGDVTPQDLVVERGGRRLIAVGTDGLRYARIDQATGALPQWNTSLALHSSLALDAFGQRLYAAEPAPKAIRSYSINPENGSVETAASPRLNLPGAGLVRVVAADPLGRYVFVFRSASIDVYAVDPATGDIKASDSDSSFAAAPVDTASLPAGCHTTALASPVLAVDRAGQFLRVPCRDGSGRIFTLAINRATGALSAVGHVTAAGDAVSLATVDLGARFVFTALPAGIGVHTVDPVSGALPAVASSLASAAAPVAMTVDVTGRRLYALLADHSISTWTLDADGEWKFAGSVASDGVAAPVIDLTGRFAYVPNGAARTISRYAIGPTGTLGARTDIPTDDSAVPLGIAPLGIVLHPSGRYAYVTDAHNSGPRLTMFNVDPGTGNLVNNTVYPNAVASAPGVVPTGIAIDPTGRFVHVASGSTINGFYIGPTNGLLFQTGQKLAGGLVLGGTVTSLVADPLGRHLYAATGNGLAVLEINRSTNNNVAGDLTAVGTLAAGAVSQLLVDPSGRRLYGAPATPSAVLSSFAVDRSAATPAIGVESTTDTDAAVAAITVSP